MLRKFKNSMIRYKEMCKQRAIEILLIILIAVEVSNG